MLAHIFRVHDALFASSRLPSLSHPGQRVSFLELLALTLIGAGVAVLSAALPDFHLRIPGHAILRSVFPLALGMAFVPRRLGGTIMGTTALATALVMRACGTGVGPGALTSLAMTGPLLDLVVVRATRNWHVYVGFLVAGLGSNLAALLVRGGLKTLTLGGAGGSRPAADWWSQAAFTYPVCGILAGLISAAVWFQLRGRKLCSSPATETT